MKMCPEIQKTVLLVDDEDSVQRVAGTALRKAGYHVLQAYDGDEAIGLCRESGDGIDLVLLDLTMPRVSGWEVFAELTLMKSTIPVVVSTGHKVKPSDFSERFGREPTAFFLKPYALKDLVLEVQRVLDDRLAA